MNTDEVLNELSKSFGLIGTGKDHSSAKQQLADKINELINSDFQKLVSILYRMDVSESKLKLVLKENANIDAGIIIADLMIERQLQKNQSRQQYKRNEDINDDEKW
jgi:hypothetical protein